MELQKLEDKQNLNNVYFHNCFLESCYKTSVVQQKLISFIASDYQKNKRQRIRISFVELRKQLGISGDYKNIRKNLRDLKKIEVVLKQKRVDDNSIDTLTFNLVTATLDNDKDTYASIELNHYFMEFMTYNKILSDPYTTYKLENISQLKSTPSIRLYQLLKQYRPFFKKSRTFAIDELKLMIGCAELDEEKKVVNEKYKKLKDFKKRVLDKAKNDLEQHCDVYFDYEVFKNPSSKNYDITFDIYHRKENLMESENALKFLDKEYDIREKYLDNLYAQWDLKFKFVFRKETMEVVEKMPFQDLQDFVDGIEERIRNKAALKSNAAYIGDVLKDKVKIRSCLLLGLKLREDEIKNESKKNKNSKLKKEREAKEQEEFNKQYIENVEFWNELNNKQKEYLANIKSLDYTKVNDDDKQNLMFDYWINKEVVEKIKEDKAEKSSFITSILGNEKRKFVFNSKFKLDKSIDDFTEIEFLGLFYKMKKEYSNFENKEFEDLAEDEKQVLVYYSTTL